MKKGFLILASVSLLLMTGCKDPVQQRARDVLTTSKAVLADAIDKYHDACVADISQKPCQLILSAAAAQDLAVDTLEAYCGFSANTPSTQECTPVKTEQGALIAALNNLANIISDIQALSAAPSATPNPDINHTMIHTSHGDVSIASILEKWRTY